MAIKILAPIDPNAPIVVKKRTKKYDDPLSVQPSAKMVSEKVVKRGTTKINYLVITFPVDDVELTESLRQAVPTVVKEEKLQDFYPEGVTAETGEPTRLVAFRCAHSQENVAAVYKFGKAHRFVFDGDIAVRALSATEEGRELERMSYAKSNSVIQLAKLAGTPYPFQFAGPAYMLKTKKTILADEMGLGKTVQAILATATAKAYPALFIVPKQLRVAPWKKEWNKWAPKRRATTVIANNDNIKSLHRTFRIKKKTGGFESRKYEVVIVHYDMLVKYMKYLKKIQWKAVVIDESHSVMNRNADRTKACIELVDAVKPEYVWLLSGTPIKAKPEQLITQLRIIGQLEAFGGRGNFMKQYCFKTTPEEEYDLKDIDLKVLAQKRHETSILLNKNLRSTCYIRRDKKDVLNDLPAKTRVTQKFRLNAEWRAKYTQIETDLVSYLLDRALQDEKFLKSIRKLSKKEKEFAISEYRAAVEYQSARAEILQKIAHCKQAAVAGKLEDIKKWIENFLETGEKLIVFFNHLIPLNEIAAHFPKINVKIVGGQNRKATPEERAKYDLSEEATERDVEIAKFQKGTCDRHKGIHEENRDCESFEYNQRHRLALCTYGAGGVGHTLTAASNVALVELPWGPTETDQAEDRAHRIGQKDNVTCHYLLSYDTIEEPISELIESKRMVVNAVHDGNPLHGMQQGSILPDLLKVLTRGKIVLIR